jgi:site-specific recombinase XerD
MSETKQNLLFPKSDLPSESGASPLSANASIQAALGLFENHMRDQGFSLNTRKAFVSDIRLLGKYLGIGQPIGEIGTKNLNDFLDWLLNKRGVPCSPKSYARRVTTLKVFFGWLHESGVLPNDPSTAVIQRSVRSPLPTLPNEEELERALAVTERLRQGDDERKPDARPHLLLTLLLQTGIKKGEAMNIVPNHIDTSQPERPILFIRYANPQLRYKERKVELTTDWLTVLDEYMGQYDVRDTIFTCTPRNLEYILSDVGDEAGLARGLLSFENLRWCAALRDWHESVEQDDIRQKLGLSKITWRDTKNKLERLTEGEEEVGS